MFNFIKRLFCKHEYITVTNLAGDHVTWFNGAKSIRKCKHCGKILYEEKADNNCSVYNNVWREI